MRIYCVWTRIVASIPPLPAPALLPQTRSSLSPFLSSRRFPEKEGVVSFLFLEISLLFRPSYRNYHRFSSPSLSLSLLFVPSLVDIPRESWSNFLSLCRVRKSDDTSNEVAAKLARVNAIISLFRLSFLRGRIWIEERKICFLAYFEGERGAIGVWNLKEGDGRRMARSSEQV